MGSDSPSIHTLCPTRWTVWAQSLASITANYKELWHLWEEAVQETKDTEMKARIRGISSQMGNFRFFFGLLLSDMVLRHTDMLSKTLQNPELSSVEGHEIAMLTVKTLQSLRSESNFDMFWEKVEMRREEFELEVLDLAVASITACFDQPGYKIYSSIEQLLFKACMGEDCDSELCSVCEFYQSRVTVEGVEDTILEKGRE